MTRKPTPMHKPTPTTAPPAADAPDLLLRNVRLVGRDGAATDVLLEDGIVSAISEGISPGGAEVVDLDGRWLAPGLWDNHVHFDQWSLVRQRVDVSRAVSAREAVEIVATRIRQHLPADQDLLVAYGYRDALWPDRPTAALLDPISEGVPIALISADLHAVWMNTAALDLVGHAGHPTGVLREQRAFDASAIITAVDDSRMDLWAGEAAAAAAARGVVGVVDLEMTLGLDRWVRRVGGGVDSLRIRVGAYPNHLDDVIARGHRSGEDIPGGRGLVTMGPFKIITDGSLGTRTAYCHDPYPGLEGTPGAFGLSTFTIDELTDHLGRASRAGFVPAVHAIGDRALDDALTAFEAVGCGGGIEHAQLATPRAISRMAVLGLVASVQPEHAMDDRDTADLYWAGRTAGAFAFESLLAAGVTLRLGSDAPVAPLDPWVAIAAAVSRSRGGRKPWHPEQRVLASAALAASTDGRGTTPVVDAPADLVVLDADPLTAPSDALRTFPVAATLLGGRFTHVAL